MKNVLLTGGCGSVGIHVLCHIMHHTDWSVAVLGSFHHKGYRDRLNYVLSCHPDWQPRIQDYQHCLTCPIPEELAIGIGPVDYILHLAAMSDVGFSIENPMYTIKNNIDSTLAMLEYARKAKPEHFIYFSTDEVYGPVRRGEAHPEWDPHRPSNAYAASKAAGEDICYAYWRSYAVPVTITNTMNNFGEMQSSYKFPVMVQKHVEAGTTVVIHGNEKEMGTRFYIHSRNVADALLFILARGPVQHQAGALDSPHRYHIVGDECVSNLDMAVVIAKLMGKELKYEVVDFHKHNPAHDIHYGLEDNNLRKNGWVQPVPFQESLANTINWQREHKEWIS